MASDLKSILTPELLGLAADKWISLGKREHADNFAQVIRNTLYSPARPEEGPHSLRPRIWPALLLISKLGLNGCPDWMDFLPPVDSPDFPSHTLGLQLVLDQAPRIFCEGVDQRWCFGYFDKLSAKYALALQQLPSHLRPSSWERWKDSVSFEYFLVLRLFFGAPLVHNEKMSDAAVAFTDETRSLIEQRFHVRDPIRDQPDRRWDLLGFPKLLSAGPPETCGIAESGFWIQELMDVHKPPLDKYGRYPYRNWILGRDMADEEEDWIQKSNFFKPPPEEVRRKIREDVERGLWSPLGSGAGPS